MTDISLKIEATGTTLFAITLDGVEHDLEQRGTGYWRLDGYTLSEGPGIEWPEALALAVRALRSEG